MRLIGFDDFDDWFRLNGRGARLSGLIQLIPFACTSTLREPVLTVIAAFVRWTNPGIRPTAGRAASARITLVRPRQCDGTIVRLAKLLAGPTALYPVR